jgi:photosystem II stability/assembly factor-like uncharacterized protein
VRKPILGVVFAFACATWSGPMAAAEPAPSGDVLERPALASPIAARHLLLAVTQAGDALVAVGPRGHILVSPDAGMSWNQAAVPVSSDLTAVYFPSPKRGWAVGHDGVVLATSDGGATWTKQLDGRAVNALVLADLKTKLAANPQSTLLQGLTAEAERNVEAGADKPFLDVWFENDTTGWVVGAYNLLLRTTDGGQTWESWYDRTENPRLMNLYAIRPAAGHLFIAGEGGTVLRLDAAVGRFVAVPVDYAGSLFGIADTGDAVLVHGLRGNAFRSIDTGASWTRVDAGLPATIVSSTSPQPGVVILADQGGRLAISHDGATTFKPVPVQKTLPLTSIVDVGGGRLAATGPFGVMVVGPDAAR